jgi:hypothetical protein
MRSGALMATGIFLFFSVALRLSTRKPGRNRGEGVAVDDFFPGRLSQYTRRAPQVP